MKKWTLLLLFAAALAPHAATQTIQTADEQLRSEYRGKTLSLRGFYLGKELRFDEDGTIVGAKVIGSWTLANIKIKEIVATTQEIQIKGERIGYWFKGTDRKAVGLGELRIEISLPRGADPLSASRLAISRVFLRQDESPCPLLPQYWQVFCAGEDKLAQNTAWAAILESNHLRPYNSKPKPANTAAESVVPPNNSESKPANTAPESVVPPYAEYAADPEYTKEAVAEHVDGKVVLKIVVDEKGRARAVTIVKPLGLGLDESAVKTVSHWRFRPATRKGEPIPVEINVEMNFRCCGLVP